MKSSVIAKIIKKQIVGKSEIILPSIGAIELQDLPATFSEDGKTINPPFRKIVFNTLRFNDDDILASLAADAEGVGLPEGKQIVKDYVAEVRAALSKEKRYEIEGVGVLSPSKTGGIEFTADPGFEAVSDSFGLETVCLENAEQENTEPENVCTEKTGETEESARPENSDGTTEPGKTESGKTEESGTKETAGKTKTAEVKKRNRRFVTLMWIFIAVIAVIIAAALIYIFREPLRPMLEKILYDSEQLKILHFKG